MPETSTTGGILGGRAEIQMMQATAADRRRGESDGKPLATGSGRPVEAVNPGAARLGNRFAGR